MFRSLLRDCLRNVALPVLRKVDGSVNPQWTFIKALVEDRHISQEEIDKEIAHDDRVIDEMIGILPTPQYPLPEDRECTF